MTSLDVQKIEEIPIPVQTLTLLIHKRRKPKWEKALLEKLTIATTEGTPNSLKLKVEIETTNTAKKKSITTLVDSRATGEFIDRQYAKSCWFNLIKLTRPILVYNVDGSPNKASSVTEAVMNAPYFLSFSFPLLPTYRTLSLLFPFSLHHPWTSLCLPFASWLLYLDMTHYDSFFESYLFLDLQTSDDSFYESSLYLAYDSYGLWLTCSYY